MNQVVLMGRLTADPTVVNTNRANVTRYTLAVDRVQRQGEERTADFINCVCFGKVAEFASRYLTKGMKIAITGRIQTGEYKDKDGKRVFTTDIIVYSHEFCERKSANNSPSAAPQKSDDDFMYIPQDISDEELPF